MAALTDLTDLGVAPGVIVACSGGRDSIALLHAAWVGGYAPHAVCIDHGLGPHGPAALAHVAAVCAAWEVPFEGVQVEVGEGDGPEDAARRARYAALNRASRARGDALVLTAHTADDHLETVLMRFAAGAGARGLAGIPRRRGQIYRPWLAVDRETVAAYARAHDLTWFEDPTNASQRFLRNRVRQVLAPALDETFGPGWRTGVHATARIAAADDAARDARIAEICGQIGRSDGASIALKLLAPIVAGERRAVLHHLCRDVPARRQRTAIDALEALLDRGGRQRDLAGGFRAVVRSGRIWVLPPGHTLK